MKINTTLKILGLLLLFNISIPLCQGQVNFGIELLEDNQTYVVSILSDKDVPSPGNRIGTAQITIKVPTETQFEIKDLTSSFDRVHWAFNARVNAPIESPGFDYLSFGLLSMGTDAIPMIAGESVPVFSFKSEGGCPGEISLVDNQSDPFHYPNSSKVNIKNHVSILGLGMHAYRKNFSNSATCREIEEQEIIASNYEILSVQPNPVQDVLELTYSNPTKGNMDIQIFDLTGKNLQKVSSVNNETTETMSFDVSQLAKGCYLIHISKEGEDPSSFKFIKI